MNTYIYQLPEDKGLKVVIRVFNEMRIDVVKTELESQSFHSKEVIRLRRYKNEIPILLVLIKLLKPRLPFIT
jgi:hypothetical protein